mmetsp:Transcript_108167/g.248043  ORF Transcript_108167/g.248043 Transcript_108167/m.248043 type:complete len:134 (-) Transcript_108167:104-505(-)
MMQHLDVMKSRFTMEVYDLLDMNCNHFSNELVQFLTGKPVPAELLNQSKLVSQHSLAAVLRPLVRNSNMASDGHCASRVNKSVNEVEDDVGPHDIRMLSDVDCPVPQVPRPFLKALPQPLITGDSDGLTGQDC